MLLVALSLCHNFMYIWKHPIQTWQSISNELVSTKARFARTCSCDRCPFACVIPLSISGTTQYKHDTWFSLGQQALREHLVTILMICSILFIGYLSHLIILRACPGYQFVVPAYKQKCGNAAQRTPPPKNWTRNSTTLCNWHCAQTCPTAS